MSLRHQIRKHIFPLGILVLLINLIPASAAPYVYKSDTAEPYDYKHSSGTGTIVSQTMDISTGLVHLAHKAECSWGWLSSCSKTEYVYGYFKQMIYADQWDTYRLDITTSGGFDLTGDSEGSPDGTFGDYSLDVKVVVKKGTTQYLSQIIHSEAGGISYLGKNDDVGINWQGSTTFGYTTGTFTVYYYFYLYVTTAAGGLFPGSTWSEIDLNGYLGYSLLQLYRCNCGE